eukprot:7856205-Karenia_brevis.AAC.1
MQMNQEEHLKENANVLRTLHTMCNMTDEDVAALKGRVEHLEQQWQIWNDQSAQQPPQEQAASRGLTEEYNLTPTASPRVNEEVVDPEQQWWDATEQLQEERQLTPGDDVRAAMVDSPP